MKNRLLKFITLTTLAAACNTPDEYYALPKPAHLEFGQPMTASVSGVSSDQSAVDLTKDWKSMAKLEVGRKPFGSTSKTPIWVMNSGDLPASLENIWMNSSEEDMFKVTSDCGNVIPGKTWCLLNVMYSPNTIGETPTKLNVAYENGEGESSQVTLPVMATASNLAFLNFEKDNVEIQDTTVGYSLSGTYKVLYNGSSLKAKGLTIEPAKGVTISNPTDGSFKIDKSGTTCGTVIESDCVIKVLFSPANEGAVNAYFGLNYFNGAEVLKINAESKGEGLKAEVLATLGSALADFGSVVASPVAPKFMSVPVSFSGSVPAEKVAITGPASASFQIINDPSKTTCVNGKISGNCVFWVSFNPQAIGNYTDSIKITYLSQGQPRDALTVSLAGKAVAPAKVTSDLNLLAFGDVPAFKKITKSFTLKNNGDVAVSSLSALTVSGAGFTGAFEAKCSTLAAADTCKLNISYQIKTAEVSAGNFSFSYFDGREVKNIQLSATAKGTSPLVMESGNTIDFGDIMIGHPVPPAAKSATISIYGTTPLTNASQLVFPAQLTSPFSSTLGFGSNCKAPLDPNKANSCKFDISVLTNVGLTPDVLISKSFSLAYEGDGKNGAGSLPFTVKMMPRKAPQLAFSALGTFKKVSVNDSHEVSFTIKNNSAYFATSHKDIQITGSTAFKVASNNCS